MIVWPRIIVPSSPAQPSLPCIFSLRLFSRSPPLCPRRGGSSTAATVTRWQCENARSMNRTWMTRKRCTLYATPSNYSTVDTARPVEPLNRLIPGGMHESSMRSPRARYSFDSRRVRARPSSSILPDSMQKILCVLSTQATVVSCVTVISRVVQGIARKPAPTTCWLVVATVIVESQQAVFRGHEKNAHCPGPIVRYGRCDSVICYSTGRRRIKGCRTYGERCDSSSVFL